MTLLMVVLTTIYVLDVGLLAINVWFIVEVGAAISWAASVFIAFMALWILMLMHKADPR